MRHCRAVAQLTGEAVGSVNAKSGSVDWGGG